jgi:hypothetical protein
MNTVQHTLPAMIPHEDLDVDAWPGIQFLHAVQFIAMIIFGCNVCASVVMGLASNLHDCEHVSCFEVAEWSGHVCCVC